MYDLKNKGELYEAVGVICIKIDRTEDDSMQVATAQRGSIQMKGSCQVGQRLHLEGHQMKVW